jgi:hypothetical protein
MARFRELTGAGHIVAENKLDADGKPIRPRLRRPWSASGS